MTSPEQHLADPTAATPKLCPSCGGRYAVDALFCPIDGTPLQLSSASSGPDKDPYLGSEILGHIEIRQLVGIGAMGRVYRAFQKGIDRDVAVKILHRELSANQQLVARFHREARVASRLQHAHVVHVYLSGQLPDGAMYIVMEYLDGLSLQSALAAAGGSMPLARALRVALQICDAAGEAHAQGIIHRDIKPENVMLVRRADDDDFVKVLDFGIARLNWGEQSMATAAGLIFGTARYISPEGAQGEGVTPESDVYSIATLLYQMLSGRTPFEGESAVALLVQQIHDPPPPLHTIARSAYVPAPIARVIMHNLAKQPKDREPDARALGRALLDAAKQAGLSPEELIARPTLLGARASAPMHVASMQRTKQMELSQAMQEQLARAFPPPRSQAPSNATVKWTPPPGLEAKLATPPPSQVPASRSSNVDITLDDESATPPPVGIAPRGSATPAPPSSGPHGLGGGTQRVSPIPAVLATPLPVPAARVSKPPSSVDSTLSDEPKVRLPSRARAIAIVLLCFFVGVVAAAGIAWKMGLVGQDTTAQLDETVQRATDALMHQRFDQPPGNNVLDITNEGLARFPNDEHLLHIRALACDDVMKQARAQQRDGQIAEAVRLAKLARELDPSDEEAARLEQQWEDLMSRASLEPSPGPSSSAKGPVATSVTAGIDVGPAAPKTGQAVDLTARIVTAPANAQRPQFEAASFVITGPGAPGVRVAALGDAATGFHASYMFRAPGRFTIVFHARGPAANVASTRTVDVTGAVLPAPSGALSAHAAPPASSTAMSPAPAPTTTEEPATTATPAPTTTASGKWL